MTYILRALSPDGTQSFYNGKAGPAWTSTDPIEAFPWTRIDLARTVATRFNRMTEIHGLRFTAVKTKDFV